MPPFFAAHRSSRLRHRTWPRLLLALMVALLPGIGLQAQPSDTAAYAALHAGRYADAQERFADLLDDGAYQHAGAYAAAFLRAGTYRDGLQAVDRYLRAAPDAPRLHYARGLLLEATGAYDDALAAYQRAFEADRAYAPTAVAFANLLDATGRAPIAERLYADVVRAYKDGRLRTAEALAAGARAAAATDAYRDANEAYRLAHDLAPGDPDVLTGWGDLFRAAHNDADAQRTYEDALALDPTHDAALVGYARSVDGFGRQEELASQALEGNPSSVAARTLLAELRVLDGLYGEAEAQVGEALAVNPNAVDALAQLASIHYLRGDSAAYLEVEQQVRRIDPSPSGFYRTITRNADRRFRYPDALRFAEQAVRNGRRDAAAYEAYGTALLRTGNREAARQAFERSFDLDPYNLFVANTLTLLDEYESFSTLTSPHFALLIPDRERDVLGALILEEAEAAYASMAARYPYRSDGPIVLEAYDDASDFGVRIAGVPHRGLLGVSFGDVVALNTPRAQAGSGPHNWARTLWHELAHTMAIGTSGHRVPRWFTEGLAVYEERRADPAWGRELELQLLQAFDDGRLLPLTEIDRGFTRPTFPGQILLSYYHASEVIAFLVDTHGFEGVVGLLEALGRDQSMEAAFEAVLGQPMAAVDAAFRATLRQRRDTLRRALQGVPASADDTLDPSAAAGGWMVRLREGQEALGRGALAEAEAAFRAALDVYPAYAGPGNAYEGLGAVYDAQGDPAARIAILERFLTVSDYGADAARTLGAHYRTQGDPVRATRYLRRSLAVDPYDASTREALAELYAQQGATAEAVRERQALVGLDPTDPSAAYLALAEALVQNDQPDRAKRVVLHALELAPGYRDAQRLLLELVEQ